MSTITSSYIPGFKSGEFHHAVLSISGGIHKLYLDGNLVQQSTLTNPFTTMTSVTQTFIGANPALNNSFRGFIGDVRVYNKVITATQVSNLYMNRNLIAYYPFDTSVNYLIPNYATLQYDARMVGGSLVSGLVGTSALQLTNSTTGNASQYLSATPTNFYLNPTTGLTISCWVNFDSTANTNKIMRIFDIPYTLGKKGLGVDISGTNMIYSDYTPLNLVLWLDAADASTWTATGSIWKDKSGWKNIAGGTHNANGFGTRNISGGYYNIQFDAGGVNYDYNSTINNFVMNTYPLTFFFVFKFLKSYASDHFGMVWNAFYNIADAPLGSIQLSVINPSLGVVIFKISMAGGGININTPAMSIYDTHIITLQVNSTGTTPYFINVDGSQVTSGTTSSFPTNPGKYKGGIHPRACSFSISESIVYQSELSESQIINVEGYLAWKWGLQTQLPPAHTYKNKAPVNNLP